MRSNPERTAWIVLITAFSIFCLISVLIPASLYRYAISATDPLSVELTSVRGIVLVGNPDAELSASVTDGQSVPYEESQKISTDDTSQAILNFADDSSLTLYGDTSVILHEARRPRFGISSQPTEIKVELLHGRVRATASREADDLQFDIHTPDADIYLNQGSFSVELNEEVTQVITRLGEATVVSGDAFVRLKQGERAIVGENIPLSNPLPAAQNLLTGSNFTTTLTDTWDVYTISPIESMTTTADVIIFQNQPVLNLRSEGEDNIHSEVGVIQYVNKDVRDFQSLRVFAEVRLAYQSLPGGGQLGSEFPIMLNVAYRDADGNERNWFHGFYYSPPPDNYILYNQPDNSSERIARFIWYPYESVNLLATLGPAKPVYIRSVRIYASGWIYDSMVANISLLAEE